MKRGSSLRVDLEGRHPYRLLYLLVAFSGAVFWLYLLVKNPPQSTSRDTKSDAPEEPAPGLHFPSDLEQLHKLSKVLQNYHKSNPLYVLVLFSSAYLFKQTFAIPGSVFMNLLAGALFGLWPGFAMSCLFTATGASFCYLLSKYCGKYYVVRYFPQKVDFLRRKLDENRSGLISILLFLRLFPLTPNWFLNMASPIIGVPIHLFFFSVFVGCLLSELKSLDDIFTSATILKLAVIAAVALLPSALLRRLRPSAEGLPQEETTLIEAKAC